MFVVCAYMCMFVVCFECCYVMFVCCDMMCWVSHCTMMAILVSVSSIISKHTRVYVCSVYIHVYVCSVFWFLLLYCVCVVMICYVSPCSMMAILVSVVSVICKQIRVYVCSVWIHVYVCSVLWFLIGYVVCVVIGYVTRRGAPWWPFSSLSRRLSVNRYVCRFVVRIYTCIFVVCIDFCCVVSRVLWYDVLRVLWYDVLYIMCYLACVVIWGAYDE